MKGMVAVGNLIMLKGDSVQTANLPMTWRSSRGRLLSERWGRGWSFTSCKEPIWSIIYKNSSHHANMGRINRPKQIT
jgi:hypothetical protein